MSESGLPGTPDHAEPVSDAPRVPVSVCMATYNGARFLTAQVESILSELGDDDELVVVDDASQDESVRVLESFRDPRIIVHRSPENRGYVRSFEAAIASARGGILLLADQDDVWVPGRVERLRRALAQGAVAASDIRLLDSGEPLRSPWTGRVWGVGESRPTRNILRTLLGDIPYFGCAMAIRRDVIDLILPFPPFLVESHDLWISLVGNVRDQMVHVQEPTLYRRVHETNASTSRPRGAGQVIRSRVMLIRALLEARRRVRLKNS